MYERAEGDGLDRETQEFTQAVTQIRREGITQVRRGASLRARRRTLLACVSILACGSTRLFAQDAPRPELALQEANDLAADGAIAKERKIPILLFFNRVGCPYCERALREFLLPMERNAANASRVMFRQVETDRMTKMVDFKGEPVRHRQFATRYKIKLTPTIWIVDGDGNSLADPMVGLTTPDYYGYYLDRAIDEAGKKLKGS